MFSMFGWTPSLRRMLRGRLLPCGCSVGVYETRSGEVVQILDARAAGCHVPGHTIDSVVAADSDGLDDDEEPVATPHAAAR